MPTNIYKSTWIIFTAFAVMLVLTGGSAFAQVSITRVDFENGKAVNAASYDAVSGKPIPTVGSINPETGQYQPGQGYGPMKEVQNAPAEPADGTKGDYFSAGKWVRYDPDFEPPKFQDIESYRVSSWQKIWR